MSAVEIRLDGCLLFDISGTGREAVSGSYSTSELANLMIEAWLPYFECHQCGRFAFCPFPERSPSNPHRAKDIQCGIASKALREFIQRTAPLTVGRPQHVLQDYLDAAFHFLQFVYRSEVQTGMFQDGDILDWFGEAAPLAFGQVVSLRTPLNEMARLMEHFPEFRTTGRILLVEGESERAFLLKLRECHLASLLYFEVQTYSGAGNAQKRQMRLLLEEYKRRGLRVFIQGDRDGRKTGKVDDLVNSSLVDVDKAFAFDFDFESSVPPQLAVAALEHLGVLSGEQGKAIVDSWPASPTSTIEFLAGVGIDLTQRKVAFATAVAELMLPVHWYGSEKLMSSELGRFLAFVQRI